MARRKFVAGNWKMFGNLQANRVLVEGVLAELSHLTQVDVVVCPPFPYLDQVVHLSRGSSLKVGAQDVSPYASGAYTGDVAAAMLADLGCAYTLVGHSERRAGHGETDDVVALKFAAARQAGLKPVLCVGETLEERRQGLTEEVVCRQLEAVVSGSAGVECLRDAVLAYEPVWAIGSGLAATPAEAQLVHAALRSKIKGWDAVTAANLQIVYGGSVKAENAAELFAQQDIDGGLIGGASLNTKDFLAICQAANF